MSLHDLIDAGSIHASLRVAGKKQLLRALAALAAQRAGVPEELVMAVVVERERLSPTGLGGGIAIPHGRVAGVARPTAVLARLDPPVDYDALDGVPVDLAVLIVAPAEDGVAHLKSLARVSRALRDRGLVTRLRDATGADALYAIIGGPPRSRAA